MRLAYVLALGGALLLVAGASASPPRVVRFTSLLHAETQTTVKYPSSEPTKVAGVVTVVRSANEAMSLNVLLSKTARTTIDGVNFNRRLAIAVWLQTPTAGYEVNVTKMSLARVGRIAQWCVRATVDSAPAGQPRTGYVWTQTHVVTVPVPKRTIGLPKTTRNWVLRDQHGNVMNVSHSESSWEAPGRRPRPTAVAKGCPR